MVDIYFTDFFDVLPDDLENYGAFNISLVNDIPLFIDPFLLFHSEDKTYRRLHDEIINYVRFLKDKSTLDGVDLGLLKAWYFFSEVKQNWLGYSKTGNKGSGLGYKFAISLKNNLNAIFTDFGDERVARASHLEKLTLVSENVGRDNISDFTTNLLKDFLLKYTQDFAVQHVKPSKRKVFPVLRARFNYITESWETRKYELPAIGRDFVILTPKDILTKDDTWISRGDLFNNYEDIASAIPNEQLRSQLNNYFSSILPREPKNKDFKQAIQRTLLRYPQILEYYIRQKEDSGDRAVSISSYRVAETEALFIDQVSALVSALTSTTRFYEREESTFAEAREKALFLKDVIENKDGYRIFYIEGKPIKRELDLQILFRLTWHASPSDINREVNNGRGPADFTVSRGRKDKALVEFKLASNSQLKRNLEKQVSIYEKASDTSQSLKVILYFSEQELQKIQSILKDLRMTAREDVILIDARNDNKPSGSKA